MEKLSILIPAFNEEATITPLLKALSELILPVRKEILIINDCSTDKTKELVELFRDANPQENIVLYSLFVNSGKGAALKKRN